MKRMARMLRTVLRHLKDTRGVSLYEITAAVAMTGILAAVAVPVIIEKTTEAKIVRVTQETQSIIAAINSFVSVTGKLPGEAEGAILLLSGPQGFHALLPDGAGAAFNVPGVTISDTAHTCSPPACRNLNDYLVRDPNLIFGPINGVQTRYPNWKQAFLDTEIFIDQFDRSYIVNVAARYKGEPSPPGSCGFGWVISGGPDRLLQTTFTATTLHTASDDIGSNTGKRVTADGTGCQ